jgi:hypothetical protein
MANGTFGQETLKLAAESALRERPASTRLNRTDDNDPTIVESIPAWRPHGVSTRSPSPLDVHLLAAENLFELSANSSSN